MLLPDALGDSGASGAIADPSGGTAGAGDDPGSGTPDAAATEAAAPAAPGSTDADAAAAASGTRPRPIAELASPAWVATTAAATGIPPRALAAYAGAGLQLAAELPGCGIGWNTLAAVGQVETHHGTIHDGVVADDGRVLPRIVGLPLDGAGFDAVPDTDGGALDGDPVWDRAVGPMQFIPSTWDFAGADGDLDGSSDPDDIDDAALAAARYLCAAGRDLSTDEGWIAAIRSYNSSTEYNNQVAAASDTYAVAAMTGATAR